MDCAAKVVGHGNGLLMPRLTRLASFWAFVVFAALIVLQIIPYTGIFLMIVAGGLITGLVLHVFLIALFAEACARRVPRFLIAIPIAAYAGYYALLGGQALLIANKSAELRAANPGQVLQFDPDTQSLVTKEANDFVTHYAIPVAYEPNPGVKPEGYLSYRLIRRDQCNSVRKDTQARIQIWGMHFNNIFQKALCVLRFPEAPEHAPVVATRRDYEESWKRRWSISEYSTELVLDSKVIAIYRSASVFRLPVLPIVYIGCALNSGKPAWECAADFMTTHTTLDVVPNAIDRARYDSPLSVMLGIPKYKAEELEHFQGYPQNDAALTRVAAEPERVEDEVFRVLTEIIEGRNPKPTFNMAYSVAQNPTRLAPLAEAMAKRLGELIEASVKVTPNRDEQIRALAGGLSALPRDAFARIAEAVFSLIERTGNSWDLMPVLYVRAADLGPSSLTFYRRDFMTGRVKGYLKILPVLAICRIGQGDDEVVAEMKGRFLAPNDAGDFNAYQSSLLVTLLKLGQESFLREHLDAVPARLRQWTDAVLRKEGLTETGPNNCMGERWTSTVYLPQIIAPALEYRGRWTPRTNS
jgi:hypothetical protein